MHAFRAQPRRAGPRFGFLLLFLFCEVPEAIFVAESGFSSSPLACSKTEDTRGKYLLLRESTVCCVVGDRDFTPELLALGYKYFWYIRR